MGKPVFSKPFIPSRPNTLRSPVINTPVIKTTIINTPVINTPVINTPVNISATLKKTQNVLKSQTEVEEVEEVGDIIPFFSKHFSPDAVKKWNVMISKQQSSTAGHDQESHNSRHL